MTLFGGVKAGQIVRALRYIQLGKGGKVSLGGVL